MNLIKCADRAARSVCESCGKGGVNRSESDQLYWGHDMDRPGHKFCNRCQARRSFVLLNPDGTRHDCTGKYAGNGDSVTSEPEPAPKRFGFGTTTASATATVEPATVEAEPAPKVTPAPANGAGARLDAVNALLEMLAPKVDESQVRDILRSENAALINDLRSEIRTALDGIEVPARIEVALPDGDVRKIGACHSVLPQVIKVAKFRHVLMVGPAGTGKSHIPAQVAEAYGVPYFEMSVNPQMTKTDLLGYKDANGVYHRTLFRDWFEHGGVFHFDEIDAGLPGIVMTINGALAQPQIAFPDGMVQRSDKFMRAIASANTFGRGADRVYQGRQPLDQSTLNRFAVMPITYDRAFEHSLCEATGAPAHMITEVLRYVRAIRDRVERESMPVIVSMRDSVGLCELVNDGVSTSDAVNWMVRRGLSDTDWAKVTLGVSDLSVW